MRLKFPKSNVAWEVTEDSLRRTVDISAKLDVPGIGQCFVVERVSRTVLEAYHGDGNAHLSEMVLRRLEAEVGRKLVRG